MKDTLSVSQPDTSKFATKVIEGATADWVLGLSAIWVIFIMGLLLILLYKYTLGKWTEEYPNPYKLETLGLPRGVLRGIITLTLLFMVIIIEVVNMKTGRLEAHADKLFDAFKIMIAFYFGSKVMHHLASVDKNKTVEVAKKIATSKETKENFSDSEAVG